MKYKIKYQEVWSKDNIIDKEDIIEAKNSDDAIDCIIFGSDCNNIKIIDYHPESEEDNG